MKKLIILILFVIFLLPYSDPTITVRASVNEQYCRIITEDTPFYTDASGLNVSFYLPYTYYVKVIEQTGNFYHVEVECEDLTPIDGYVPCDMVFFDDFFVSSPYPKIQLTTSKNTALYFDVSLTKTIQYVFSSRKMNYYGKITASDGTNLYYVEYNNKLGYIKEEDIMPFTIANHPNELTFIKKDEPSVNTNTPPQENTSTTPTDNQFNFDIKSLIIICLMIAGIIALFVAFSKKPKTKSFSYYDESEFE